MAKTEKEPDKKSGFLKRVFGGGKSKKGKPPSKPESNAKRERKQQDISDATVSASEKKSSYTEMGDPKWSLKENAGTRTTKHQSPQFSGRPGSTVDIEWDKSKFKSEEVYIVIGQDWKSMRETKVVVPNKGHCRYKLSKNLDPLLSHTIYIETVDYEPAFWRYYPLKIMANDESPADVVDQGLRIIVPVDIQAYVVEESSTLLEEKGKSGKTESSKEKDMVLPEKEPPTSTDKDGNPKPCQFSGKAGEILEIEWKKSKFKSEEVSITLIQDWHVMGGTTVIVSNEGNYQYKLPKHLSSKRDYHFHIKTVNRKPAFWRYYTLEIISDHDWMDPDPEEKSLPKGIHLHWAMPDALMVGEENDNVVNDEASLEEMQTFPHLPNRWLVVRQWPDKKSPQDKNLKLQSYTGWKSKAWVINANDKTATELSQWNSPGFEDSSMTAIDDGDPATADDALTWTAVYEESKGRFTFHDTPEPKVQGPLNYMVAGWYSNASQDPLYCHNNLTRGEWKDRLEELEWSVIEREIIDRIGNPPIPAGIGGVFSGK